MAVRRPRKGISLKKMDNGMKNEQVVERFSKLGINAGSIAGLGIVCMADRSKTDRSEKNEPNISIWGNCSRISDSSIE